MVWTGLKALLLLEIWRVKGYAGWLTQSRVFRLIGLCETCSLIGKGCQKRMGLLNGLMTVREQL